MPNEHLGLMAVGLAATIAAHVSAGACDAPQVDKLLPADTTAGQSVGTDVDFHADTIVAGAQGDNAGGAAYVFINDAGAWVEQQKLLASDGIPGDLLGKSVAIDADTIIVGAPGEGSGPTGFGAAYVYERAGAVWTETQKLKPASGNLGDEFGFSVNISGDIIAVGMRRDDDGGGNAGTVLVYERIAGNWVFLQKILGETTQDEFGYTVHLDADTLAVGAIGDDDAASSGGAVYVYTRTGNFFTIQQKLTSDDAETSDRLGWSVHVRGDRLITGTPFHGPGEKGAAYIFERDAGAWTQTAKLVDGNPAFVEPWFGESVALHGGLALIGARCDDSGDLPNVGGSAYLFALEGGTWSQVGKLVADDAAQFDQFGWSVATDAGTAVVGSIGDDDGGNSSGALYLYDVSACAPSIADPPDFDGDGDVDAADLNTLLGDFGCTPPPDCAGDVDGDGDTDADDLNILLGLFGT